MRNMSLLRATAIFSIVTVVAACRTTTDDADLDKLTGRYVFGGGSYTIKEDHTFVCAGSRIFGGGDVVSSFSLSGDIFREGGSFVFIVKPTSIAGSHFPATFPFKTRAVLYSIHTAQTEYLLDDDTLLSIVNQANRNPGQAIDATYLMHRSGTAPDQWPVQSLSAGELLPTQFRKLLLTKPVSGKVIKIGAINSREINVSGWMQPVVMKPQYTARLTINVGANSHLFKGMMLYFPANKLSSMTVESIGDQQSEVTYSWMESDEPVLDSAVSSAQ